MATKPLLTVTDWNDPVQVFHYHRDRLTEELTYNLRRLPGEANAAARKVLRTEYRAAVHRIIDELEATLRSLRAKNTTTL